MTTHFPPIYEKRYTDYPRRYLNEYSFYRGNHLPSAKGATTTLANAKMRAMRAVELYDFRAARIFDRKTGQYVHTYTKGANGPVRHEGFVK